MTQGPPRDPYVEAKLLGILLSGVFGQTREDSGTAERLARELRPSGTYPRAPGQPPPEAGHSAATSVPVALVEDLDDE